MAPPRPTLIYDGDCGICRRWVESWAALTGDAVEYRPYQTAAADYPSIPLETFRRSIQLVEPDARVYAGAAATFRVLRHAPRRGAWWWLYTRVPGFASLAESAYAFLARRRGLLSGVTALLWGTLEPPRYDLVRFVFLRGIGLIYFAAFASLAVQILGLIGHDGILPLVSFLGALHRNFGSAAYALVPTAFWLDASDTAIFGGTFLGMALALLVVANVAVRPSLVALFALYLSYTYAGQAFTTFQWDALLLEAGFLAIFLPGGSVTLVWLYRWLVFRYVFMAGTAKVVSGDVSWQSFEALRYHFMTQPLPTPLAWYAAQLPHWMLAAATAGTLVIEVMLVFLVFAPRRPRMFAAGCIIVFQFLIVLTGNYNFFNLLTILLCVFLFDDAALRRLLPKALASRVAIVRATRTATRAAAALALIVIPVGVDRISRLLAQRPLPLVERMTDALAPLLIVNSYGLFANMTTSRPEIILEGSADGVQWTEYTFRYKPGPLTRRPSWNVPHQPRLDWQMWFAALDGAPQERWIAGLVYRLLEGSGPVVDLLATNPFPNQPPRFVRATLYDYRFTDAATRSATGAWWTRRDPQPYFPAVSLADFTIPAQ